MQFLNLFDLNKLVFKLRDRINYLFKHQNSGGGSSLPNGGENEQVLAIDTINGNDRVLYWKDVTGGGIPDLTATQIAFGDGDGKMTSSNGLIYNSTGYFQVKFGDDLVLAANPDEGVFGLGDVSKTHTGTAFRVLPIADIASIDNNNHNLVFGINTSSPSVALDVVGDVVFKSSNFSIGSNDYPDGLFYVQGTGSVIVGDQGNVNNTNININDPSQSIEYSALEHSFRHSIKFTDYGSGTQTGTPTHSLQVDASGYVIEEIVVKKYALQLFQSSTNQPYDNILLPQTFGGNIGWSRTAVGVYNGYFEGAFPQYKTAFRYTGYWNGQFINVYRLDTDNIQVEVLDLNLNPIDGLDGFDLVIEVYSDNQLND